MHAGYVVADPTAASTRNAQPGSVKVKQANLVAHNTVSVTVTYACMSPAGMGDSCCSMGSIGSVAKVIEDELGVFVYSIATGEGEYKDVWSSFYGRIG